MKVIILSVLVCSTFSGCSFMRVKDYDNFYDWYIGEPGFAGAIGIKKYRGMTLPALANSVIIREKRPSIYGHFRIPELLWQPAGGLTFPKMEVSPLEWQENPNPSAPSGFDSAGKKSFHEFGHNADIIEKGIISSENIIAFHEKEAGLIDNMIRYRIWFVEEDEYLFEYEPGRKLTTLSKIAYMTGLPLPIYQALGLYDMALFRTPAYIIHDTGKTLWIPIAAIYYAFHTDKKKEEAK